MLPFGKILKQAYWITKTHKFLWIFGLFLFWGSALNFLNYFFDSSNRSSDSVMPVDGPGWFAGNEGAWMMILILILLLAIAFVYLYFRAKAGLIISVKNVIEKRASGFKPGFKDAGFYYGRLIKISVAVNLSLVGLAALLSIPIVYLVIIGYPGRAIALGFLALVIFVPVYILSTFVTSISPMFVTLYNMKIKPALLATFDIIREQWVSIFFFTIILAITSVLAVFLVLFVLLAISIPVVLLARLVYHTGVPQLPIAITFFGVVVGAAAFIFTQAVVAVFQQTSWVLLFEELVKPRSAAEAAESEILPEVIT
jgi:hypothetical protein